MSSPVRQCWVIDTRTIGVRQDGMKILSGVISRRGSAGEGNHVPRRFRHNYRRATDAGHLYGKSYVTEVVNT